MFDIGFTQNGIAVLMLILIISLWQDMYHHRIPNIITFGGMVLGLGIQAWMLGFNGLIISFSGLCIGLSILLPMYISGGMAAGDVKLMAAVGAFLDPLMALMAGAFTLIAGGVLGLSVLILRGGTRVALHRYALTLLCLLRTGHVSWVPPAPDEVAATRFPYALAIAVGTVTALWWTA